MTYTLLAIFLLTGNAYVERTGLSLQSCAGHAAMARQASEVLRDSIGRVEYRCAPERSLARKVTDNVGAAHD
jgi:lipopolysaccharide export system protein LptA